MRRRKSNCPSAEDIILCIEKPQDSTKELLTLMNEFCKAAGYKIDIYKSVVFLYTNNKLAEKEIKQSYLP